MGLIPLLMFRWRNGEHYSREVGLFVAYARCRSNGRRNQHSQHSHSNRRNHSGKSLTSSGAVVNVETITIIRRCLNYCFRIQQFHRLIHAQLDSGGTRSQLQRAALLRRAKLQRFPAP